MSNTIYYRTKTNQHIKLAARRPYRECRKKTVPSYKDVSSSDSEDEFLDVDSSFNVTVDEDNTVEGEKRAVKSKGVERKLAEVTEELEGCRLDGSAIVFDADDLEDLEEIVEEGHIEGHPNNLNNDEPVVQQVIMVDFEAENGTDDAGALKDAIHQLRTLDFDEQDLEFSFNQIETKMQTNGVKKAMEQTSGTDHSNSKEIY